MGKGKGMGKYYTRKDGTNISTDNIDRRTGLLRSVSGNETSSRNLTNYEHSSNNNWTIYLKNGNTITVPASSQKAAENIRDNMPDADKKKKPTKYTKV